MFGSLLGLASDVVKVATAPVDIALSTARIVTKPLADEAQKLAKEIKNEIK
ncbi:hypothetical protein vBPpSSYP_88 [Pseudomonas phage vB_PpS_SYP]|nr:hypothetical protein vBPpSSYP_88 [Pseudomonas phage vB_PpS_SYP]